MDSSSIFAKKRNSQLTLNEVYFWTDTIHHWKRLLNPPKYKELIIAQIKDLVVKKKIVVYGFVIMPNHLHFLWEMISKNGKEMPYASFNKATGHLITKDLKQHHVSVLPFFKVEEKEREYRIWQRDPLGVLMDSKGKFEQKLDYLHNNPLHERWNLASDPADYKWSSAKYYQTGVDDFGFMTHYVERLG